MELNEKIYLQYRYFVWVLKAEPYSIGINQTRDNYTREHLPSNYSMLDSGLSVLHASSCSVLSSLLGGLRNPILTRA